MLAVMAVKIELMPDWTIFVQLGVFLSTLVVLNFLVFRPVLRIIDRRRTFTDDARADAEQKNAEAARLEDERSRSITAAIREGEVLRDGKVAASRKEAEAIVAEARESAKRLLDSTEISIESSEEAARSIISREAEGLAEEIANRIRPAKA